MRRLLVLLVLGAGWRSLGQESGPIATIQARAKLVVVDVVVRDHGHQPVRGLKAAIFALDERLEYLQGFTTDMGLLRGAVETSAKEPPRVGITLERLMAVPCENQRRPYYTRRAVKDLARYLVHGLPGPTELMFKVFVGPSGEPNEAVVVESNEAAPAVKGPFRRDTVNYKVSPQGLSFAKAGEGNYGVDLKFLAFVYNGNGEMKTSVVKTVHATLTTEAIRGMVKTGLLFHVVVTVPVGRLIL